jgi:ADP-heptose:LPS heptosyltransferase
LDRFAAVADALHADCGADVHFFGGPKDEPALARLDELARYPHSRHCLLALPTVAAALSESDLFIGNDSGLAHIAAAVNTPSVLVWGAANLTMARPVVESDRCAILHEDLPCRSRCVEVYCVNPVHAECLSAIQAPDVIREAMRLLSYRCCH